MSARPIEFQCPAHLLEHLPHPVPAARCVPEWMRAISTHVPSADQTPTVKNCMPFLEAMTFGYVIPLPADITFTMEAADLRVDIAGFEAPLVDVHSGDQLAGAPYSGTPVVKFRTPWLIRTPPGYSTLVLPPLNRFEMPFVPLAGVVETDTYYRQIAFPTLCTMKNGQQVKLARGAPLVQVIPVPRESWSLAIGPLDEQANKAQDDQWDANRHMYRDDHWQKKSFH
jgi:hypothetical protein